MDESIPLKQCCTCKQFKPATKECFASNKATLDLLQQECKHCNKIRRDHKRAENPKPIQISPIIRTCTGCRKEYPNTEEYFYQVTRKNRKTILMAICKVCSNAKSREHALKNQEKINAQQLLYRLNHKEEIKLRSQQYYQSSKNAINMRNRQYHLAHRTLYMHRLRVRYADNRELYKAKQRQYRQRNIERVAESHRKYDISHTEQIREYHRKYARIHREQQLMYSHQRRARIAQSKGSYTVQEIQSQHERQKGKCYYCSIKLGKSYHRDHIVPISRGGTNDISNIVLACPTCNTSKRDKFLHEWARGGRLI